VLAVAGPVLAQDAFPNVPTAPFEIVRSRADIDVNPDGSFVQAEETAVRVLDARGQKALQQTTLSYTDGLQTLSVKSAYTLKASGEKIPVPDDHFLRGLGATSAPGFEDVKTLTIVYPRLEVGDQIVLTTLRKQIVPLFAGEFALRRDFSRAIRADDVQVTLTAPQNALPLRTEAAGLDGGQREQYAGKYRWIWRFHNDAPTNFALDSVIASDDQPHLIASSFPNYGIVGQAYGSHFAGKADANSEIRSLADRLTSGISDRRAQARALYDWVSTHISYVNIVLGAGGFTPHAAADVLALRYGDCKDHVMLLEALLAARGIPSNPALIEAKGAFVLPGIPSPFYFNHLITYVPEFRLFLDSTAHYAPFGVLPAGDDDRPVVMVPSGEISGTPNQTADGTTDRATATVKLDPDGTAVGASQFYVTGAAAVEKRAFVELIPPDREKEMFQFVLGPGSEANIDRGNLQAISDPFTYSIHYHIPYAANFSAPGAISTGLAFGTFAAGGLTVGLLPAKRESDYACPSMMVSQISTFELPPHVDVTSVPAPVSIAAEGIRFSMHFEINSPNKVTGTTMLRADHPRAFCTPEYYNRIRSDLARIAASLRGQILYK
jgi:transglutaminase-like putative cysteine protease